MDRIHLAFKAFDVHELLCHAIAESAGLYSEAGISVSLIDCTFIPDDALPENTFHAACGATLAAFLSGQDRKIVFVACDKPMFWLYSRDDIDSLEKLDHARVATFPDVAPPAYFLKTLLLNAGVTPVFMPCRDDTARLSLLTTNNVDAAILSSAHLPHEVAARGPRQLAFIGDEQRLPSSGLAVSGNMFNAQPELIEKVVDIYQQAMSHVYSEDDTRLRIVLADAFAIPGDGLDAAIQTIRDCYNPRGISENSLLQSAVDSISAAMGLESRAATHLYDFRYVNPDHSFTH